MRCDICRSLNNPSFIGDKNRSNFYRVFKLYILLNIVLSVYALITMRQNIILLRLDCNN